MSDDERFRAEALALVAEECGEQTYITSNKYARVAVHATERRLRGDALIREMLEARKNDDLVSLELKWRAAAERYLGGQ